MQQGGDIKSRNTDAHPCRRHELLLLLVPDSPDVGVAVPVHDGEGYEDHIRLGVGEGAHVLILFLARRVADPEDEVTIIVYLLVLQKVPSDGS